MLKIAGASNARLIIGVTLIFVTITLWFGNLKVPISSWDLTDPLAATRWGAEVEPRLNTTWHKQLAREMRTDKSGLEAIMTPYGPLDRTRVALLSE